MRADGAFVYLEEHYANVYSAEDLTYLRSILKEALKDALGGGAPGEDEAGLKARIAVALFRCAGTGERDRAALSREARRAAQLT